MTPGSFVLLAALVGHLGGGNLPPPYPAPPWTAGSDETRLSGTAPLAACETLAKRLAAGTNGEVEDRTYFLSKGWGKVYRSRIVRSDPRAASATLLTCWRSAHHGFQFVTKLEGT